LAKIAVHRIKIEKMPFFTFRLPLFPGISYNKFTII